MDLLREVAARRPGQSSELCGVVPWCDEHGQSLQDDAGAAIAFIEAAQADRVDAERYRFLRSQRWNDAALFVVSGGKHGVYLGTDCPSLLRLDAMIDAAKRTANPYKHDSAI
ncbi:MAG: hypothetical protein V4772_08820 [Pseudomonadota bacterium]